jgi:uncharacterized protein (DUF2235 family)
MGEEMLKQRAQDKLEILAQMGIRKGSRVGPLLLLFLVAMLFIALSFEGGRKQVAINIGIPLSGSETPEQVNELLGKNLPSKAGEAFERKDWDFLIRKIGLPLAKAYLEELVLDFWVVTKDLLHTTGQIILYSLLPGFAGLLYRRNFWAWFFASFAVLLAIKASGLFGSAFVSGVLPESGPTFLFIGLNLVLLLLAGRLRQNSSRASLVPAWLHNLILAVILVLFGIAWGSNWGPGSWLWSVLPTSNLYKWEIILVGLPILYMLLRKSIYWRDASPKNIVVCLDGTGNTPDQYELGLLAQTNVFKLFKMLKADKQVSTGRRFDATLFKPYANRQIAFYYSGVGNKFDNDPILQNLGLAAGAGATGIVERAYLDIARVYQPGDEKRPGDRIYIFGFSRGAAIARLLARTIDTRGAPKTMWTLRLFGRHWMVWKSRAKPHDVSISVLGCWDTVGSFGIAKTVAGINFQQLNLFKDLSVPDNVEQAYHMVALDEMRDSFEPTLMEPDPITPHRIMEVWFSGDHCNVGGGWATDKLSDVTLDFLLRRISSGYAKDGTTVPGEETWGVYLKAVNGDKVDLKPVKRGDKEESNEYANAIAIHPDSLGQLRQVSSMLYRYAPRKLPLHAVISETVFERMTKSPLVYAPQNLFDHNEELEKQRRTNTSLQTQSSQYLEDLKRLCASDEPAKRLPNEGLTTTPLI